MGTYAVVSLAGSVGKTTTVTTLAVLLAQDGLRVRVIDMDSQANASSWLGLRPSQGERRPSVADVLRGRATIADVERSARQLIGYDFETGDPRYDDGIPNLTVVPAVRSSLDQVMIELSASPHGVMRLRDALAEAEPADVTLIDGAGSLSPLVVAAALAASPPDDETRPRASDWGVITCTKPSGKEVEGIPILEQELANIKKTYRLTVPLLSIVPCAVPAEVRFDASVYKEQLGDLQKKYGPIATPEVRRANIVDAAFSTLRPLPYVGYRARDVLKDYREVLKHQRGQGMFRRPGEGEDDPVARRPANATP